MSQGRAAIKSKFDGLVISSNILSIDEARSFCNSLDALTHEERVVIVRERLGALLAERLMPMLVQLAVFDKT